MKQVFQREHLICNRKLHTSVVTTNIHEYTRKTDTREYCICLTDCVLLLDRILRMHSDYSVCIALRSRTARLALFVYTVVQVTSTMILVAIILC